MRSGVWMSVPLLLYSTVSLQKQAFLEYTILFKAAGAIDHFQPCIEPAECLIQFPTRASAIFQQLALESVGASGAQQNATIESYF